MVKVLNIIKMEIYYMMVILLMENQKEMKNLVIKMVIIIQDNLKMDQEMEKVQYIIQMEK